MLSTPIESTSFAQGSQAQPPLALLLTRVAAMHCLHAMG